jgi:hypothetical protein
MKIHNTFLPAGVINALDYISNAPGNFHKCFYAIANTSATPCVGK